MVFEYPEAPRVSHRMIRTNGINIHAAFCGDGPLVLMVHGNPGLWYSWRHQFAALAGAGFRPVAIDCRGYGRTDRPTAVELHDAQRIQDDLLGVLDAFGAQRAFLVGQDFGAQHAWNLAVRVPERVLGVVGMVPYDFDLAGRCCDPHGEQAMVKPTERFAAIARRHFFHMHYFQKIGPADAELGAQPRVYLHRLFHALSARGNLLAWESVPSDGTGYLDALPEAAPLPWPWMSQQDFDYYAAEFLCRGPGLAFVGPLNAYRVADRNWELGAPWAEACITVPSLFLCGAEDPVLRMLPGEALARQRTRLRDLRGEVLIPDAGHFVQQEQPAATNEALLSFLNELRGDSGAGGVTASPGRAP
jgi:pimeloyl-ACP methyl ester carboxylesterase